LIPESIDQSPAGERFTQELSMNLFKDLLNQLNDLSNSIYETPEFVRFDNVRLTKARARFYTAHAVYFNLNRRDCWGYVLGAAPWKVKRLIWHHEEDELINDPRGDADHQSLMIREAQALGLTRNEVDSFDLIPGVKAAFYAWLFIAKNQPWLEGLAASHILERRNDTSVVKCPTSPARRKKKMIEEVGMSAEDLVSTNVHTVADVDHTKMIEDAFQQYVNDEFSFSQVVRGAKESLTVERSYRASLAHAMEEIHE
jgi:pyrroloquinoline quinone (PQQ) biosynthesis protein C